MSYFREKEGWKGQGKFRLYYHCMKDRRSNAIFFLFLWKSFILCEQPIFTKICKNYNHFLIHANEMDTERRMLKEDHSVQFSSLSRVRLFATPWITARQTSLSITKSRSLLKLMPIESVMPSRHLILCRPHLLLPPIPPSIRVFSNESTLHMRWPKYWSFSFSISPSNEHPGLISFRMDWLDLLAVYAKAFDCVEDN